MRTGEENDEQRSKVRGQGGDRHRRRHRHRTGDARPAGERGATLLFAERQGKLDLLVNFAGVLRAVRSVEEMLEDFVRILQVNLVGTFLCCREALPISANPRAIS